MKKKREHMLNLTIIFSSEIYVQRQNETNSGRVPVKSFLFKFSTTLNFEVSMEF